MSRYEGFWKKPKRYLVCMLTPYIVERKSFIGGAWQWIKPARPRKSEGFAVIKD
jgi:hypothetical protein